MQKKQLREIYKQKRAALNEADKAIALQNILRHCKQLPFPHIQYLHHYLPVSALHELPPNNIISYLEIKFPQLIKVIPRMKQNDLEAVVFSPKLKLIKNRWGVAELEAGELIEAAMLDCILVPLLAFDLKGNRVGYGKGCYDRFLSRCAPHAMKIGLSYFEPVKEISDTDHFDIPLNYCITPERIYEFG
jgi:5-formyltetrahydrofolate cyclo-ligase